MAAFNELPIELLPCILQHIFKPNHLALVCLVNKAFHAFSVVLLYEITSILHWHKDAKTKIIKLFHTLAAYPHLARHVRRLEIRDFPKSLAPVEHDRILDSCVRGISNAINLTSCTWTRDGSINSDILRALQRCPRLDDLEINGHHPGNYDPKLLRQFTTLSKIRLIMPSALVIETLPAWIHALKTNLRTLTIICKSSSLVSDNLLQTLAPDLGHLEELHVVGCTKLTHEGVLAVILQNETGIENLSVEGLSPAFDIVQFNIQCQKHRLLRRLRTFTVTIGLTTVPCEWTPYIVDALSASPLEHFQIYCAGGYNFSSLDERLCSDIVSAHRYRLKRFSVHRIPLSLDSLDDICTRCVKLEQLFIVVGHDSLDSIVKSLSKARSLRAVHINFTLKTRLHGLHDVTHEQLLSLVKQCSSTVTQIGCNMRVWQVAREVIWEDGQQTTRTTLGPYDRPDVPEQFRIVKA